MHVSAVDASLAYSVWNGQKSRRTFRMRESYRIVTKIRGEIAENVPYMEILPDSDKDLRRNRGERFLNFRICLHSTLHSEENIRLICDCCIQHAESWT